VSESRPRGYFDQSRDLTNSLILVAPILVFYEVGLLFTDFQGMNGVDFATILVLHYGSWKGLLAFNLAILVAIAFAAHARRREHSFSPGIAPLVIAESTVYALSLGSVIGFIMRKIPTLGPPEGMSPVAGVVASLGAGVNEELFFRLGLLQMIAWTLEDRAGTKKGWATGVAVVVSSILFSAAHYLGSEHFEVHTFVYRFLAGTIFAGLFLSRGLAVAVYTHAIYDIHVLVVLPLLGAG
jgi:membrane protease YdiL (CAAX protease family)